MSETLPDYIKKDLTHCIISILSLSEDIRGGLSLRTGRGIMRQAIVFAFILSVIAVSDTLIYDDFDDGIADGWVEIPTGAAYEVEGGRYHFSHTAPDTAMAASLTGDLFGLMTVPSYSIRTQIEIESGDITGITARYDIFDNSGYAVTLLTEYGGILAISRMDQGVLEILTFTFTSIVQGQEYWVRFELNGSDIGAKIWTGSTEPASWLLTVVDTTYQNPGSVGLLSIDENSGGTAALSAWFDEFLVEDELTLSLSPNTWAAIKSMGI